jgi:hypothetical protein
MLVVAKFTPPAKEPEAPLVGAEKVTVTPLTGFPCESSTVTSNGLAKAVLTAVLCGVPALAAMEDGLAALWVTVKL